MRRLTLAILLVLSLVSSAWSHLNSFSFSNIEVLDEKLVYELRFPYINTLELFAIDTNMDQVLTEEELEPAKQIMYYYFDNKIKVLSEGRQLKMVLDDAVFIEDEEGSVVSITFSFPGYRKPNPAILFCNVSEEVDPFHQNIAVIEMDGKRYLFTFTNSTYLNTSEITPDMEIKDPRERKRPRARLIRPGDAGDPGSATGEVSSATDESED